MANRLLRDWTASETIDKLSERAEVFFTRLIMKADDHGCYYGNTKLLKAALFPLRDHQLSHIRAWRDECVSAGVIQLYVIDAKEYVRIVNFGQRMRSMISKFPQPADIPPSDDSNPRTNDGGSRTSVSNPPPEGKRREEKGSGREGITSDFFETKKHAFEEITANYHDIDSAQIILRNRGWPAVTESDARALLFHFLESQTDVLLKQKIEVRQHYSNWLNKKEINELTKISLSIKANYERQRQGQGQKLEVPGNAGQIPESG